MQLFDFRKRETVLQGIALAISGIAALVTLGLFAFLGTFTRYLADDYCETLRVTSASILKSLLQRYLTTSDRYSNLLFVGVSESLAPRNVQIVPVAMIIFWTGALIWLVWEIKQRVGLQWPFLLRTCSERAGRPRGHPSAAVFRPRGGRRHELREYRGHDRP